MLHFEKTATTLIVRPDGPEIGADRADEFRQGLLGGLSDQDWVACDLSAITFMDSSGLGVLVAAVKALRGRGEFRLYGVHPRIEELFRLTGLHRVFVIDANRECALAGLEASRTRARSA